MNAEDQPIPSEYLVQHVRDALAADPRARELGVDARVVGAQLVLTGSVATPDQRAAIVEVTREVVDLEAGPTLEVVNEMTVMGRREDEPAEELS